MLTNNFKRIVISSASDPTYGAKIINRNGAEASVAGGGSSYLNTCANKFGQKLVLSNLEGMARAGFSCFVLGKGTTPESETDYTLADIIADTNFQIGTSTATSSGSSLTSNVVYTRTYTYIGNEELTISEIGLFQAYNDYTPAYLLAREVLDSPITVNNGDTFVITMAIG